MLKETIHFTDYNGEPATTVEYFNLNKNEIIDLEASVEGGLAAMMHRIQDNPTAKGVLELLKTLTHAAYGIKSDDGKYFDKSPEITNRFIRSAYYDDFLFSLIENDAVKGLEFIKGVIPPKLLEAAENQLQGKQATEAAQVNYEPNARERFAAIQAAKAESGQVAQPQVGSPAQSARPLPTSGETESSTEFAEFQEWKRQQEAAKATQAASAPASPDAFRIRENNPDAS